MNSKRLAWTFGIAAAVGVGGYLTFRLVQLSDTDEPQSIPVSADHTVTFRRAGDQGSIRIASFNIQFLGNSKTRDDDALAGLMKDQDIVVVQELVAPPYDGAFPGGDPFKPDAQAAEFFEAMTARGFRYVLSEEDTGTGPVNHLNSSATEWFVTFYKPGAVKIATDLPGGFLAEDRSDNPDFERVPYAFPFRTVDNKSDFILISVHLQPDASTAAAARRKHEMSAIDPWIMAQGGDEKDFIILGDMNIESRAEMVEILPVGYASLNDNCVSTNTNVKGPKPYDHVFYHGRYTGPEIDRAYGFKVLNLSELMRDHWNAAAGAYPGDPYDHDAFRAVYSDHNPVLFRMSSGMDRD